MPEFGRLSAVGRGGVIGSVGPDTERAPSYSADARGDDIYPQSNASEEDGWPRDLTMSVLDRRNMFSRTVQCNGLGMVAAWVDFDRNGTFDADERTQAACVGGAADLRWTVPDDANAGQTFVRLRYASDANAVALPTGSAADGEVEDHLFTILGPKLSVSKTNNAVNGAWTVNQPDAYYRLVVRNDGPVATGDNIKVLDELPAGLVAGWSGVLRHNGWECALAGQRVTCETSQVLGNAGSATSTSTIDLPVTIPETFNGTTAINYASVGGGLDPFNNGQPLVPGASCTDRDHCATNTVTINWNPGLTVEKSAVWPDANGDGKLELGETITYSFVVTNTGSVTLTNVAVQDALPGITLSGAPISSLAPGAVDRTSYSATYVVTQADVDRGYLANSATASGLPPAGSGVTTPIVSPPSVVTLPPDQTASLSVKKRGSLVDLNSNGRADVGDQIEYAFEIKNDGKTTLTNVTLVDRDVTPQLVVSGGPIASLSPGQVDTTTYTAVYTLTQADIDAGVYVNTAYATGTPPGSRPDITSPDSTETISLVAKPGLSVVKTGTWVDMPVGDGDGAFGTGDLVNYTFEVTNTGNVTLTNITVSDQLPGIAMTGGPILSLAPGAKDTATITGTYTVTQVDTDRGAVTNTARASGETPSGDRIDSPPSSVTLPPEKTAEIEVEKRFVRFTDVDGSGTTNAGDTAHYEFEVRNTGRVTLTNVTVEDALPQAIVSGTIATLAPGATDTSLTAIYTLTQQDIDAGKVENSATASGFPPNNRPPVTSVPSHVTETIPPAAALRVVRTGRYDDSNGDGFASAGDLITYEFEVTNTGNTTLAQVSPVDRGPTFDGIAAEAKLSAFVPRLATLAPGGGQIFTATYTITQLDAERAGGKVDAVANVAAAKGATLTGTPVLSDDATSIVTLPGVKPGSVSLNKQALTRLVRRGEQALFRIELTNNGPGVITDITLRDTVPNGFRYVDGSASIDGNLVTPISSGRQVEVTGLKLNAGQKVALELKVLALASATPGTHINLADALQADGTAIATQAQAGFELVAEAIFDCSDIIGKVFDDRNQNGYQDEGEPGLSAARLVTARGLIITADQFGRYSVPCAAIPDARIGSNFIIKLDEASLPTGYALTTENPEVVRLTAGKMAEVNFGASLGREVRLDLDAKAFFAGSTEAIPPLVDYLPQLIELLSQQRSVLRLGYLAQPGDGLGEARLEAIEAAIERLWHDAGEPFALTIDMTVEQK